MFLKGTPNLSRSECCQGDSTVSHPTLFILPLQISFDIKIIIKFINVLYHIEFQPEATLPLAPLKVLFILS
jgi:hypothetical protein